MAIAQQTAEPIPVRRARAVDNAQRVNVLAYVYVAVGISFATAILNMARHWLAWGDLALIYLPLIIAYATWFGFGPAVAAACMGFLACDYYFIPPYYGFFSNTPAGWISLSVFMFAALSTARLGARMREQATEARARERETAMLYEASQAISREIDADRLLPTLVEEVVRMAGASECAVFQYLDDRSMEAAAYASTQGDQWQHGRAVEGMARAHLEHFTLSNREPADEAYRLELEEPSTPENCAGIYEALMVHRTPMGVLYVGFRPDKRAFTPQDERLIRTLANHAAVVIARQRLREESEQQERQTAIVEERNRLARDVHDALSHTFTGIKFLLEAADKVGPPEALDCIKEARQLAVEGAQEARRSVLALRPAPLEEAGDLAAAIGNMARRQAAGDTIDIDFDVTGEPFALPALVEENLLRTCQEALSNVMRHADASQVDIRLGFEPGAVTLSVKDDGVGFTPEAITTGTGFGLTSMRQRCRRLGAELIIRSQIGDGTEILIRTPIRDLKNGATQ